MLLASVAAAAPIQAQGALPGGGVLRPSVTAAGAKGAPAATPATKSLLGAPPAPAAAGPDAEAAKLYTDGVRAEVAGQLERARDLLQKSFDLKQTADTALHLGRVELRTLKYLEAAQHLTFYLEQGQGISDLDRKTTEKQIADAKAKLGTITVRVDITGAEVLVDGQSIGTSPLTEPLVLEPGAWQFEARKEGYTSARQSLSVKPGETLEVSLKLAPQPPTVEEEEVKKPSEAVTPPTPEKPPEEPAPPPPKWRMWAMIGGAGLTAVGLGVGVGLTVAANGESKDATERLAAMKKTTPTTYTVCGAKGYPLNRNTCTTLKDTLSAQDRMTNGAVAMYVIGGVAALGTAALYLYPRFLRKRATGVLIMPAIGSDQKGLVVSGSF